jgi:menaquinone-9 beta-reductase
MNTEALVIGGGLSGAALATRLARAGRDVVLLEREHAPADKMCGEFLSREAGLYLTSLGIDLPALGAVTIDKVRLCEGAQVSTSKLPFTATSLSRRVLDEVLLECAANAGAKVLRGAKVSALTRAESGSGWNVAQSDGTTNAANAVFLATGKYDLRGHKRPPGLQDDLVAFKLYYHLAPEQVAALDQHVELITFEGGYAGLQMIDGGRANLCLLVRRSRFASLGQQWKNLLASMRAESKHLERRLDGATPCWNKPLALSSIPYGHVRSESDGLWRLGDQAAVIPSFSGDGMSIALHSAELAAATYLGGGDARTYQKRLASDVKGQVLLATGLSQALVRSLGQFALGKAARFWPGLMSTVAFHTRVSDAALARTTALSTTA